MICLFYITENKAPHINIIFFYIFEQLIVKPVKLNYNSLGKPKARLGHTGLEASL